MLTRDDVLLPRIRLQVGPALSLCMLCGGTLLDYSTVWDSMERKAIGSYSAAFLLYAYIPVLAGLALIHLFLVGNSDPGYVGAKSVQSRHWDKDSDDYSDRDREEAGVFVPETRRNYGDLRHNYYDYCERCQINLPIDRSICHCDTCDACVEGLDHHCPWVGNCIGMRNEKFFWRFNGCWGLLLTQMLLCVLFS